MSPQKDVSSKLLRVAGNHPIGQPKPSFWRMRIRDRGGKIYIVLQIAFRAFRKGT